MLAGNSLPTPSRFATQEVEGCVLGLMYHVLRLKCALYQVKRVLIRAIIQNIISSRITSLTNICLEEGLNKLMKHLCSVLCRWKLVRDCLAFPMIY